jgi:GH24 family phage-related lysozyme (muramidase)
MISKPMLTFKQYILERNFLLPLATAGALMMGAMGGAGQKQTQSKPIAPKDPVVQPAVSVNKIPQQAVDTIISFEKCHLKGYRCPSGVPTIGYGNTRYSTGQAVKEGDTITKEKAKEEFKYHLSKKVLPNMEKIEGWNDMNDNQRAALISFAYNAGENFYGNKNYGTISKALKEKRWDDVPAAMKLYNKGRNENKELVVLNGLVRRRDVESKLWSTPIEKK